MYVFVSFCTHSIKSSWNPLIFFVMHFLTNILANDSAISSSYSYKIFCHFLESSRAHSAVGLRTAICWWQWCVLLLSSSQLFQLNIYFVKCRQTPLPLNSLEPCSSSKGKRKFCHGLLTSSIKCEMYKKKCTKRNEQKEMNKKKCTKSVLYVQSSHFVLLIRPYIVFWWTFSLPSSLILFVLFSINMERCLYEDQLILVLILVFVYFLCGIGKYSFVIKNNRKMQTI